MLLKQFKSNFNRCVLFHLFFLSFIPLPLSDFNDAKFYGKFPSKCFFRDWGDETLGKKVVISEWLEF